MRLIFLYLCPQEALVLELVDKRDLKSLGQKCPYGFDPRPEHENGVDWISSSPPRFDFFKISSFSYHPSKIRPSAWEDLPYYFLLNEYTRLSIKYLPVIFSHVCMEDSAVTVSVKDEPESNRFTQCADTFSMPLQNSYDREAFSV